MDGSQWLEEVGVDQERLKEILMENSGYGQEVIFAEEIQELRGRLKKLSKARNFLEDEPDLIQQVDQRTIQIQKVIDGPRNRKGRRLRTDVSKLKSCAAAVVYVLVRSRMRIGGQVGMICAGVLHALLPDDFQKPEDGLPGEHDTATQKFWVFRHGGKNRWEKITIEWAAYFKGCDKETIKDGIESGLLDTLRLEGGELNVLVNEKLFELGVKGEKM